MIVDVQAPYPRLYRLPDETQKWARLVHNGFCANSAYVVLADGTIWGVQYDGSFRELRVDEMATESHIFGSEAALMQHGYMRVPVDCQRTERTIKQLRQANRVWSWRTHGCRRLV